MRGVILRAEQVDGNIRFVADHPTIVPRRNIENVPCFHFDDFAVAHGRRGFAGNDNSDVLNFTHGLIEIATDVRRPLPAGLVRGSTQSHSGDIKEIESALLERAYLVGRVEALENYVSDLHSRILVEVRAAQIEAAVLADHLAVRPLQLCRAVWTVNGSIAFSFVGLRRLARLLGRIHADTIARNRACRCHGGVQTKKTIVFPSTEPPAHADKSGCRAIPFHCAATP